MEQPVVSMIWRSNDGKRAGSGYINVACVALNSQSLQILLQDMSSFPRLDYCSGFLRRSDDRLRVYWFNFGEPQLIVSLALVLVAVSVSVPLAGSDLSIINTSLRLLFLWCKSVEIKAQNKSRFRLYAVEPHRWWERMMLVMWSKRRKLWFGCPNCYQSLSSHTKRHNQNQSLFAQFR